MNNHFQPIQRLQNAADQGKSGHLQIIANQVTWNLYFVEGMLQDATHSLQSLDTIHHYLLRNNQTAIAKLIPTLAKNVPPNHPVIPGICKQLREQNYLTDDEMFMVSTDLIKDALESYLWLRDGQYHWYDYAQNQSSYRTTIKGDHLLAISTLLDTLMMRMKAWKLLSYVITSPYQRLVCPNPSLIQQKIPSGNLNPTALEKLVKVMEGKTLRKISLFLKQDEIKVAQLLLPYFQNNILELQPPQPPLDQLPFISSLTPIPQINHPQVTLTSSIESHEHPLPQTQKQKPYKIVCIDDSPTILDMIKAYLSGEQFEVFTIDNPTQSLPCLFECKPDLILLDFSMPGINGNKLCRIIKGSSCFKNTPIIMISGNQKMLTPENMTAAAATDCLAKPFKKEMLLRMINKHLNENTNINQAPATTITKNNASSMGIFPSKINNKNISTTPTFEDNVTNLPNRQGFKKDLSVLLKKAQNKHFSFTLIFLKMDNFEAIKKLLGETVTNEILKDITKRLQASIRATDILAKWNSNEFVILFKNMSNIYIVEKIAERIVDTVKQTPLIFEYQLALEISKAIKLYPQDKQEIELLLTKSPLTVESMRSQKTVI
ncbi:MAG: diguanylate cyclase [Crocosphaera sp.]